MKKKENKIKTLKGNFQLLVGQDCQHRWVPLVARAGKKNIPTSLFTCLKCGEMKVGKHTIRISRYRMDVDGKPITSLGAMVLVAALSGDGTYSGICEDGTSGGTLVFGDICYFITASSKWALAKADVVGTSTSKLGMCVLAGNDTAATKMLLFGKINAAALFPTLTIGAPVYISAATAGVITNTQPAATDNVVRVIGYGNTGDELFFCPSPDYITHT